MQQFLVRKHKNNPQPKLGAYLDPTGISRGLTNSPPDCLLRAAACRPVSGAGAPHRAAPLGAGLALCDPRPCSGSLHPPQAAVACAAIYRKRAFSIAPTGISRGLTNSPLDCSLRTAVRRPVSGAGAPHRAAPLGAGLALCDPWPCSGSLYPPQAAVACAAIPRTEAQK